VEELLTLMSAMTGDNRFEETINDFKGKEKVNMCEVLDRVEARGIEKGIEQGRSEERNNSIARFIKYVKLGVISKKDACQDLGLTEKELEKYLQV